MIFPHCYHPTSPQYGQKTEQCCWCGVVRRELFPHAEHPLHGIYLKLPVWYYDDGYNQPYFTAEGVTEEPTCVERPASPYAPMISQTKGEPNE